MKAAQNGVPNISVLDGWWDEGYTGDNGWAIGGRDTEPRRGRPGLGRRPGPVRPARGRPHPALLRARPGGHPDAAGSRSCAARWRPRCGASRRPGCSRSTPSGCTCRRPGSRSSGATPEPVGRRRPADRRGARISLALALHNHQPVGNFGWVFAEVFEQAYEPMVAALERHPGVRLSLHYTGPLLEWLVAERPDFIDRLRALADRGQVEILGGGYYEPVLASLPERDRIGQLRRMGDELEAPLRPATGRRVAGRAGLGAGPADLAGRRRLRWTILDDAHFRAAAIPEERPVGAVHDRGPGPPAARLRDRAGPALPHPVPRRRARSSTTCATTRPRRGDRVGMMGDDGEKFGAWPSTWEHCWGEGRWVERFFEALEANADWLTTTTPSAWLADHPPIGRVYVPTGSYAEMGEWALPAGREPGLHRRPPPRPGRAPARGALAARRVLAQLPGQVPRDQRPPQADAAGVGGGRGDAGRARTASGRSTTSTRASRTTATGTACSAASTSATCAWPRTSTSSPPRTWPRPRPARSSRAELRDLDMDGVDEVRLADAGQVVTVDLDGGAGIGGWDIRAVRHALAAVMRRRPEAYHDDPARATPHEARRAEHGGERRRAGLHPRHVPGQGAGARRAARVRRLRAALRPRPGPRAGRHAGRLGDGPGRRSSATPSTARSRSSTSARTGSSPAARRPSPAPP